MPRWSNFHRIWTWDTGHIYMNNTHHTPIKRKIKFPSTLGNSTQEKLGPWGTFQYWSKGWPDKEPPKILFAVAFLQGPGIICNSNLERILNYFLQIYSFHMWNEIIKTPHQLLELEFFFFKARNCWLNPYFPQSSTNLICQKLFTVMNNDFAYKYVFVSGFLIYIC